MGQTMLTISGRVTQQPKIRHGKSTGAPFCIVSVAVNNDRFDREQERWVNTDTTFYELVCFGALGANAVASLKVGDPVVALGRFKVSGWETDSFRSQTPTLNCEHLGPDLRFGTTVFTKGQAGYATDKVDEEVDFREHDAERGADPTVRPTATGQEGQASNHDHGGSGHADDGPRADADGVVSEEDAGTYYARSA
jgi:single-strand DNA-binding protein